MAESRSKNKSPVAQQQARRGRIIGIVALSLVAVLAVILLTSFLYKKGRGEPWEPFAFIFGKNEEPTLPPLPTDPPALLTSLMDLSTTETGESSPVPDTTTESESETPELTETESPEETTTEEATPEETTTEEATPEETTTEETTPEETTTEETTPEETTPEETESESPEESTTQEPLDESSLSAHLQAAGLDESILEGSQLVVVRGLADLNCALYFFEKDGDDWILSAAVPATKGILGTDGIRADKKPGDQSVPAGYFSFGPVYGMADSAVTNMDYHHFESGDEWVTDTKSIYYNQLANTHQEDMDWKEAIDFFPLADQFKYAVLIGYNGGESPNKTLGLSIFLNLRSAEETGSSIGVKESTLFAILQWLSPEADPHILIYQDETASQ